MISTSLNELHTLAEAIILVEFKLDSFVCALEVLCLLIYSTFELKRNAFDCIRQLLEIHFQSIAIMLRYVDGPILLSQGALALKVKLRWWHYTAKLVLVRLRETCFPHVIQNSLLEVNVKGLARNITTFIQRINFPLRWGNASG